MSTSIVSNDGRILTFDATTGISFSPVIAITDHPIEDGSIISDHAQKLPLTISLTGIISKNALSATAWEYANTNRQKEAVEFFESIIGQLVSLVTTKFGTIPNLMLVRYPYTVDNIERTIFNIDLKEVTIASATAVFIEPSIPNTEVSSSMSSPVDIGEQSTTTPTETEQEADSSILFTWFGGD
jgi:hypothetical protein